MSTVLEKPVLLDETGQAIVGKLNEIKDAIDSGGSEKYPVLIYVETMPTKTNYIAGEQLNLAGIVVKAVFSNNIEYDITSQCSFNPANGSVLASSDTTITASYTWHPTSTTFQTTFAISIKTITGISVTTPPTKTSYIKGEALDLTGIAVSLNYDDASSIDITSSCVFNPSDGSILDDVTLTAVNIGYTDILGHSYSTSQDIEIILPIYGAEWDGSESSVWIRTDSAADFTDPVPQMSDGNGGWTQGSSPFDNILPWSGMEQVSDATAGELVKIPKYYYKLTSNGTGLKLQISPTQMDGFLVSPAHADRGDGQGERDFVYIAKYHGSTVDAKSVSGATPYTNYSRANFRTNIASLAADVWQNDYAMFWTVRFLMLVEFADWNITSKIGRGGNPSSTTTGQTDQMTYHTGTTASDRTTQSHVLYRYIEDLWASVMDWVDGICFGPNYALSVYGFKNPANFSDAYGSASAVLLGTKGDNTNPNTVKEWEIPSVSGFEFALIPKTVISTSGYPHTSYTCAYYAYNNNADALSTGLSGPFDYYGNRSGTSIITTIGTRLMKLPNNS